MLVCVTLLLLPRKRLEKVAHQYPSFFVSSIFTEIKFNRFEIIFQINSQHTFPVVFYGSFHSCF